MSAVTVESLVSFYAETGVDGDLVRSICEGSSIVDALAQLETITGIPFAQRTVSTDSAEVAHTAAEYDAALADGEEKRQAERRAMDGELFLSKMKDIQHLVEQDRAFDRLVAKQRSLGPQSGRNFDLVAEIGRQCTGHKKSCFEEMLKHEKQHCGEFVVFYHSYSLAALLYEVQCCISRVVYELPDNFPPLPRLVKGPFATMPYVRVALAAIQHAGGDHDIGFRGVGLSTSVSMYSATSEAPPMQVFDQGYSCGDVDFPGLLNKILVSAGVNSSSLSAASSDVCKVGREFNIPLGTCSGKGQMLQIFVRTDCVDDVAYGSRAYGVYEGSMNPLSKYLTASKAPDGQARVLWHPTLFLDSTKTRVYHYAADKSYTAKRLDLQRALQKVLTPYLFSTPSQLIHTFKCVEGEET